MNDVSNMIARIQEIIYYLRIQNYYEGNVRFRGIIGELPGMKCFATELASMDSPLSQVLQQLLDALENDDMVLLADMLEEALLPVLKDALTAREITHRGIYVLEPTSSGFLTVKDLNVNLYLHSNCNPMEEARILVQQTYRPQFEQYAVWGCGLGYHILKLYEAANGAISITVFEEKEEIVRIAEETGLLSRIPKDRLRFVVDGTGKEFANFISDHQKGIFMHFPSIKCIKHQELQRVLHDFFASWNGTMLLEKELEINFRCNSKNCTGNVDELKGIFAGKSIILVAGGPSVDDRLTYLKEQKGNKIIVAVATVLKKLLHLGIEPDYAVVMDSNPRTYIQTKGIETDTIPMILDSTAYWEVAEYYPGPKYIAYQKAYRLSEEAAGKENRETYETGGSVTTLALELLLRYDVKAIYLVGVDMAYPGGNSHATDTRDSGMRDVTGMEMVESVTGGMVPTESLFNGYRKWIEQKLSEYRNVMVYNMSVGGARIEGTIHYSGE